MLTTFWVLPVIILAFWFAFFVYLNLGPPNGRPSKTLFIFGNLAYIVTFFGAVFVAIKLSP